MSEKYNIVRFYKDKPCKVIYTGLTLEEAREHCKRTDSRGPDWFDGYTRV